MVALMNSGNWNQWTAEIILVYFPYMIPQQSCPTALSSMMEMYHICVVQCSSHYPRVPWNLANMTEELDLILMRFIYKFTDFFIIPFCISDLSFWNHFLLHEAHPLRSFLVKVGCGKV